MLIKIAGAGCWIEDGAGFVFANGVFRVIGEEDGILIVLVEGAGVEIAGEERS